MFKVGSLGDFWLRVDKVDGVDMLISWIHSFYHCLLPTAYCLSISAICRLPSAKKRKYKNQLPDFILPFLYFRTKLLAFFWLITFFPVAPVLAWALIGVNVCFLVVLVVSPDNGFYEAVTHYVFFIQLNLSDPVDVP